MFIQNKKEEKFAIYTAFTRGEIRLILDAFVRVSVEDLQKDKKWALVEFTRQVFLGIKRDALDSKWNLWSSVLMSKLYRMNEDNIKVLKGFVLSWKQETEGQRAIILKDFFDPDSDFPKVEKPAA